MAFVKPKKRADADPAPEAPPLGLDELAAELEQGDAARRRAAARALGARADGLDLLLDRLPRESAASVRGVLATVFIERRSRHVAARLAQNLAEEDALLRNMAIELLQAMPEEADEAVGDLLSSPDSDLRIFGVNILSATAHPGAPARLVEVIERDEHVNVCAAAVDGLTEIGTEEALPALKTLRMRFANVPFMVFAIDAAKTRIEGR